MEKFIQEAANDLLDKLADAPDKPLTVTARDRRRGLQVVVTVSSFVPMTISPAMLAKIKESSQWPDEVVNLAPAVAAAS